MSILSNFSGRGFDRFREEQERRNQRNQRSTRQDPGGFSSSAQSSVLGILDRQQSIADRNREDTLADRDAALSILDSRLGQRSDEFQSTFESLQADPGDTPFANLLRSSIQQTLDNPDVFGADQIDSFVSRSNEAASRAVQDALLATRVGNAQRGVQGGIAQGVEDQLNLQATADAIGAEGDIRLQAAEARATNLATAQQLGVSFESATQQARNQRLAQLSQFVSQAEINDLEIVTGMAEILANTVRENPDFSGYAAIVSDIEQSANDLLLQRENLALLREQIAVQERLGLADADSRSRLAQSQLDYNRTLRAVEDELDEFQRAFRSRGGN